MKLNVVFALVALFAAQALCFESRMLLKEAEAATTTALKADNGFVGSKIVAFSKEGKAKAVVKAFAAAEQKFVNDFIYFFKKVLAKDYVKKCCKVKPFVPGKCCPKAAAFIEEDFVAAAYAAAKAYTEVTAEVYVEGTGKACAAAEAYAYEKAEAFLDVCVKALVAAKVGYSASAAGTYVKGYKALVAEVFTKTWTIACVSDGFAASYQKAFAEAIAKVCVKLVLDLAAYEGCTKEKTYNDSSLDVKEKEKTVAVTEGKDAIKGKGFIKSGGFAAAKTDIDGEIIDKHFVKGWP